MQKKITEKRDKEQLVLPGFVLTNSLEKLANELFGMDDLNLWKRNVTKHIEMMVAGDDVVCVCRNSTVNEFVVVGIGGDETESKVWVNRDDEKRIPQRTEEISDGHTPMA